MRRRVKRILAVLLSLLAVGLTLAIVGSYVVAVYADTAVDSAVVETLSGFMLVMPEAAKRAVRIGGVVIIISIVAGFIGFMSAE